MNASQPVSTRPHSPVGLHDRAIENIHFIRRTMESSASFTSVSGTGGMLMGLTALLTALVASQVADDQSWLLTWVAGGFLAFIIGALTLVAKARASGVQLSRGVGRKFLSALTPPLAAAAVLTLVLFREGVTSVIPGVWLLLYGTAVIGGGAFSIRIIPAMGLCFMALGIVAFLTPAEWADVMLALGFGGCHLVFGLVIARRHGG